MLNLTSLRIRRIRGDLIQLNNLLTLVKATFSNYEGNRGHKLKLYKKSCKLNIINYSFLNKIITDWNNLPTNVLVAATNVNHFKNLLVDTIHMNYLKLIKHTISYMVATEI